MAARRVQTVLLGAVWQTPLVRSPPAWASPVLFTTNVGGSGAAQPTGGAAALPGRLSQSRPRPPRPWAFPSPRLRRARWLGARGIFSYDANHRRVQGGA